MIPTYPKEGNLPYQAQWHPVKLVQSSWPIKLTITLKFLYKYNYTAKIKKKKKNRDITLETKVHIAKAIVFPVVMYGCESWTIKKTEPQRIDAFELWCWRRLLRVPWTAKRSNQSILKEISPEYSLEGLMLKLQCFGHLMRRIDSFEKTLMLERLKARGEGDNRG